MTVEEASIGGLGAHVLTLASDAGLIDAGLKLRTMRLPDRFQDQDKPEKQYADAGLDADAHRRDGAEGAAPQQRGGGRGRAGLARCAALLGKTRCLPLLPPRLGNASVICPAARNGGGRG